MTFSFSFLTILLFFGFIQALTLTGILIYRFAVKKRGDILFNLLFFMTLYIYLTDLLIPTGLYLAVPFLLFTDFPVLFLIPPVLLLYIQKMTGRGPRKRAVFIRCLLFIPFIIITAAHVPRFLMPGEEKIYMFQQGIIPAPMLGSIHMFTLAILQFFLFLLYCFILLYRTRPSLDQLKFRKLRNILFLYLLIFAGVVYFLTMLQNYPSWDTSYLRLIKDFPIFIILVYNYILLLADSQPGAYIVMSVGVESGTGSTAEGQGESDEQKPKYLKSGLQPGADRKIFENLCRVIEEEKLWSDSDLDLRTLAEQTGTTYHNLSQVINQNTALNYHAFINRYRIVEACRLLQETDLNILEIAYESGFNSKPTFNKVFKSVKECTPSQFRREKQSK